MIQDIQLTKIIIQRKIKRAHLLGLCCSYQAITYKVMSFTNIHKTH